ncbi:MAG: winged helix-turn-helix domain-containing protein [Gammaproteobacteria bacterium]|nr:winged helix-turn-helix domain-containing protein [Gammaproteobacteria bacterium]
MSTYTDLRKGFELGPWKVLPDRNLLRDGEREEHLEPTPMNVLVVLAARQGEVLSKDELNDAVWDGRAQGDEPLQRAIAQLREKLGDDARNPTFIETITRRGYRLKTPVILPQGTPPPVAETAVGGFNWVPWAGAVVVVALGVVLLNVFRDGSPRPAGAPMESVAVFPFQCPGNTAEYLCFGFSEELTSTLLQAQNIKVVKSRNPMPASGSDQEIAATLNVVGLLTGSVQQIEERVKISAELVDARDGRVVLSDTLEGSVSDIFRLQEQVASVIARSISGSAQPVLRAASEPTSFEAFQAYARGQLEFDVRNLASIERAIELFEETIRLDPLFGPAYLRLAYAYLLLPDYDPNVSAEAMYELATARTDAGIQADPSILEPAGTVFGFIHQQRGEWLRATEAFEMAVSAQTVYPIAHHWYSRLLGTVGRLDDALTHARRAHELDPDSAVLISRLAIASFWVGDLETAGRYFAMASKMRLDAPIHYLAYSLYLVRVGEIDTAKLVARATLEKNQMKSGWTDTIIDGIADPALRPAAVELFEQVAASGLLPRYIQVTVWALLDEADRAMDAARQIDAWGESFELEVIFSPDLAVLRAHPDFPLLLERSGLNAYWLEIGCAWEGGRLACE